MSLAQLTDPAAVLAAIAEFDRLGRTAFLAKFGFGRSRDYMLRSAAGALYDSKAIAGAAHVFQHPDIGPLLQSDFSGGERTVERKLRDLGFEVVQVGHNWTKEEVESAVVDYLEMLELESKGIAFNKKERNEHLRRALRERSKGSVELKHQNISFVLDELGLPFIRGYKPRGNVQELLRAVVCDQLLKHRLILERAIDGLEQFTAPSTRNFRAALVAPPMPEAHSLRLPRLRLPRKVDYAARDESNRALGRSGEEWVLGYEAYRLTEIGRPDATASIRWVAELDGDGTGYDIRSSSTGDDCRFIEVKTTNGGPGTPFVVSANELGFSREAGDEFFLYRLFEYSRLPQLFLLQGDLERVLNLQPIDFRARLKAL